MLGNKILLLGATGMAGHVVYYYLNATGKYQIINVVYRNKLTHDSFILDVTDRLTTEKLIKEVNPNIIINCIGILKKESLSHPDNAIYINAYFPHFLERLCSEINAKLIHISSDCVFSGKNGNYSETDVRDADDLYGMSKGLGEVINGKDLTFRTSIIGPEIKQNGEGLFHKFMEMKGEINGYTESLWGGVTTIELAKAIDTSIDKNVSGLVHLTNGEKISKFDLLNLFKQIWNRTDINIKPYKRKTEDKSLLKSEKINYFIPSYFEMIEEQYKWMYSNSKLYKDIYN